MLDLGVTVDGIPLTRVKGRALSPGQYAVDEKTGTYRWRLPAQPRKRDRTFVVSYIVHASPRSHRHNPPRKAHP